jgi:hypothetical protein
MAQADPRNIQPAGVAPQQSLREVLLDEAMANMQQGRVPGNFTAQMMDKLFSCGLPTEHSDFSAYEEMIRCCLNLLPRIPNYNAETYRNLIRDFEDLIDVAHSEGNERVCASDMCKMLINLRALVPRGDFELRGLTGVSAIITTRQDAKQEVRMPQQSEKSGGIFGFLRK